MRQTHAVVTWQTDGVPASRHFGDIYYSRQNGLAESRHVFIEGNTLPARFDSGRPRTWRIGETGFGTGLNFLAVWQTFMEHAPRGSRLEYTTCERYPLRRDDMARALAPWKELSAQAQQLLAVYQPYAINRHTFADDGRIIRLCVHYASADAAVPLYAPCDAWFLDGFAPARNKDMWTPELLRVIHDRTAPGGTLATFTVARAVRDGLASAGFITQKVPGFAFRHEMLTGQRPVL